MANNKWAHFAVSALTGLIVLTAAACNSEAKGGAVGNHLAVIETNKGTMKVQLDDVHAPITSKNFVDLANAKFYDGLTFHRVEPGFVIQGGDPKGNGTGGSEKSITLEIWAEGDKEATIGKPLPAGKKPIIMHNAAGVISMARTSDPNSATSQFFITLGAAPHLDGGYAAFGHVTEGLDVLKNIRVGDKMTKVTIEEIKTEESK